MAPLSAAVGRFSWTCLFVRNCQLESSTCVDRASHVIPAGVTHVSRQLNVTFDLSWVDAGYDRFTVTGLFELSKTNSSRLIPMTGEPSAFFATGKRVPIVPPLPDWAISPCQPLQTIVYPCFSRSPSPSCP